MHTEVTEKKVIASFDTSGFKPLKLVSITETYRAQLNIFMCTMFLTKQDTKYCFYCTKLFSRERHPAEIQKLEKLLSVYCIFVARVYPHLEPVKVLARFLINV